MADEEGGVPAPNPPPNQQHQQHQQQQQLIQDQQQIIHLNWSNFKPDFSAKPDEDAEVHLLCS